MNANEYAAVQLIHDWPEVESEVYCPGRWLALVIGTSFVVAGIGALLVVGQVVPPNFPLWITRLCSAVFCALGGIVSAWAVRSLMAPAHIRHAGDDMLPDIPREPVIREGSVVHGRVTHELVEEDDQWSYRPRPKLWRDDKMFLFGFGIPFMTTFAGLLAWIFHSQLNFAGWLVSILCATAVTLVSGGTAFVMIGMMLRSNHLRLCKLSIPVSGADLELDSPEEPDLDKSDMATGLKWIFLGETKRQRLNIPRELVGAVQLCPWKFATRGSITWAVQGLLVLKRSPEGVFHRLPILLTNDFVGAARLMHRLANVLHVPYLYCADEEGWDAEERRAKSRPPLKIGGTVS